MLRINEYLSDVGSTARCSICGITNSFRFKEFLDPGTLSSLGQQEIRFDPYDADAITHIIEDRVEIAFAPNTVELGAVRLISALSASRGGDARCAIDLLRTAGEIVDINGAVNLTIDHVKEAEQRIEEGRVQDAIINLSKNHQIILVATIKALHAPTDFQDHSKRQVKKAASIEAPSLYEKYKESCYRYSPSFNSISYRRFHQLVNELDTAGILLAITIYQGKGRVKKISLAVPSNVLKDALSLNPVLAELFK